MPDNVAQKGRVRKFADVYPAIKQRFVQYMSESKWVRVALMTPELATLWVQQMSLWTRTAFKIRGHVYANCPHPALRRAMLEILSEEDIEDPRVGMNHRQLLATSLGRATGQTLADLEAVRPLPTTLVTFDILYGIADRSWEEGIAVASGLERVLRDSGYFRFEHDRLKKDLGWTDSDVAWFASHDVADEEHGRVIELLDDYIVDDRAWDRVEEAVVESGIAWWLLFDGIVDAQRQGIAPVEGRSCKGLSFQF
jgi:pyrroloquinoline quinone (PQQ) biosynthesis protein C